jgi:uncharacterized coiled-coil DUF342 family protein
VRSDNELLHYIQELEETILEHERAMDAYRKDIRELEETIDGYRVLISEVLTEPSAYELSSKQ